MNKWMHSCLSNNVEWQQEWETTFRGSRTQEHFQSLSCESLFFPSSHFFIGRWGVRGNLSSFHLSGGVSSRFPSLLQSTGQCWSISQPCHRMPWKPAGRKTGQRPQALWGEGGGHSGQEVTILQTWATGAMGVRVPTGDSHIKKKFFFFILESELCQSRVSKLSKVLSLAHKL